MSRLPLRLRLTLTYVALLLTLLGLVLGASWVLLERHLDRTLPARYADTVLAQLGSQYVLALVGAGLLAVGIGWWAAGSALAPLRRIAETARRVTDEHLDARVRMEDAPDDEVREVAVAFDAMLDRVAASVSAQQRFVANASHELRTPLTVIRTTAEVVLDDPDASVEELRAVAREAVETTERTEELLDALLVLASLNGGRALREEPVDLGAVAERAVSGSVGEAGRAGVEVRASLGVAPVRGDAALLERLVGNLVENAIRHGGAGAVEISAAALPAGDAGGHAGGGAGRGGADRGGPRGGSEGDGSDRLGAARGGPDRVGAAFSGGVRLRVSNGGALIPAADVARLTQPFERLGRGRAGGTGLGLSIVRAVAEAHGGTLRLEAPAAGGLTAEVLLPGPR